MMKTILDSPAIRLMVASRRRLSFSEPRKEL
jgi:hypothetical protein